MFTYYCNTVTAVFLFCIIQGPLKGNRQNKNKAQNLRNLSNRNLGTPKIQRQNRYVHVLSFCEDLHMHVGSI